MNSLNLEDSLTITHIKFNQFYTIIWLFME